MSWIKQVLDGSTQQGATKPDFEITSEEIMRDMGALAHISGVPTTEFAGDKNDLSAMVQCVAAEERNYWGQAAGSRICAAPFYFERAAILFKKNKNALSEISMCERWVAIAEDYKAQACVQAGLFALVHKGPRSAAIYERLRKAKEKLPPQP